MNTIPTTLETIRSFAIHDEKIWLIKCYRELSGMGLKEAKDKIEDNCYDSEHHPYPTPMNVNKVMALFEPFFKTREQIESERLDAIEQDRIRKEQIENEKRIQQNEKRQNMLKGIAISFDNFELLGYNSPFDAIQSVIAKFQQQWDD